MTEYETIIGLEVHAQLLTRSKMYCGCSADYAAAPPNSHVCPVCMGMPGVLPVINRKAVEYAIMTALALNCTVSGPTKFDRKNYAYPDLMKGYQISQYDAPVAVRGWLTVDVDGSEKRFGITRVHLEEDVAKLLHRNAEVGSHTLVDINRSGVPLMEIVGEPDIKSAEEARRYLMKLRAILQYLGVSTGNMEEGSFRCDANISIRPVGSKTGLPKVEVKNMNSFRAVYRALEYEANRQRKVAADGGRLVQETRGWVEEKGVTVSQRSKEFAHDYRYFPEPDLPPLQISRDWVEEIRSGLAELPDARAQRFISDYKLSLYEAGILTSTKAQAEYFESCLGLVSGNSVEKKARAVSNWLLGEFARRLNAEGIEIESSRVTPARLAELIDLADRGVLGGPAAKTVFEEMFRSGKRAADVVQEKGLTQISDTGELDSFVKQVIGGNPQAVADFKAGKQQALNFLAGQVMKASRGRANPEVVKGLLRRQLE